MMIGIRFHGRGGQGAITSARVLAYAAVKEGKYGQASQLVMGERRGAPVMAYTRIDAVKIVERGLVRSPDYLVLLDPTLVRVVNIEEDFRPGGKIIVNSPKELGLGEGAVYIDATSISLKHLGRPVVNTSMLGAFAAATGVVKLDSLIESARETFSHKLPDAMIRANVEAIKEAYEEMAKNGFDKGRAG